MEYRKNEKGVALLLALGFAALLLVLIMGFATNALIDRKVAANNGDKTQARAIAMSAVNRAIVAMQYHMQYQSANNYDEGVNRFDNIVSKRDDSDSPLSDDDLQASFLKVNNDTYLFQYRKDFPVYEYPKLTTRDYNYNEETKTAAFNRRRLPQWQDIKNADNTLIIGRFMYAALPDLGRVYKKAGETFDYNTKDRAGHSVAEFDISKIDSNFAGVDFKHPAKWFKDNKPATGDDDFDDFKARAFYLFNIIEFDSDISSAQPTPRNKKFRNDDGTFTLDMVNVFSMPRTVDELFSAVPYLNSIDTDDKTVKEKQIAANLIEAFYPGTGNVVHDGAFDDETTYTGNRRTPYINEVEVSIRNLQATVKTENIGEDVNGNPEKTKYTVTPKFEVQLGVELYSPYKTDYNLDSAKDSISGSVGFEVNGESFSIDCTGTPEDVDGEYPVLKFKKSFTGTPIEKTVDYNTEPEISLSVDVTSIGKHWKYLYDGKIIDFVKEFPAATDNKSAVLTIAKYTVDGTRDSDAVNKFVDASVDEAKKISWQVKDARFNLASTEWQTSSSDSSNLGQKNDKCGAGAAETAVVIDKYFPDVVAAVKEKVSLADLAYISRGEAGRTLNILNVEGSPPVPNDKKLLDQLTVLDMAADTDPQLIDINTRSIKIWQGLLSKIKDSEGNEIFTDTADIAKKISASMAVNGPLKNRSDFVKILTEADSSIAPDKKQNIVGKILSLCKVEDYPEYSHLIVIAQTIRDNQGLGTQGQFDANDEITSEVRYLVRLHRKPDNKMEIVWIEELID